MRFLSRQYFRVNQSFCHFYRRFPISIPANPVFLQESSLFQDAAQPLWLLFNACKNLSKVNQPPPLPVQSIVNHLSQVCQQASPFIECFFCSPSPALPWLHGSKIFSDMAIDAWDWVFYIASTDWCTEIGSLMSLPCTWVTCTHWRQRTNFTAPGCTSYTSFSSVLWLNYLFFKVENNSFELTRIFKESFIDQRWAWE